MDRRYGDNMHANGYTDTPMNNNLPQWLLTSLSVLWALAFIVTLLSGGNRVLLALFGVGSIWFFIFALVKKHKKGN